MATSGPLARRLTGSDAVMIGLGSMIGAGIFSAFAPAASAAGAFLLVGLGIAAAVALMNALSSAQLAAQYPTSGGTYIYGRERLGPWPGFVAGWCFIVGKTASCAAMALTFAAYLAPPDRQRLLAIAAVAVLAAVNLLGVTRTARVARILVSAVLGVLAVVIVAAASASGRDVSETVASGPGLYGILQSAGLLFFAFAGYARIATMGEEVVEPARTIPRAVVTALAIALGVYSAVAVSVLEVLGPKQLAASSAALVETVRVAGWAWAEPLVMAGAAAASLGALLALLAGVGRTTLAMSRHGDLPSWLGAVDPRRQVPHRAEVVVAVAAIVLVATVDLRGAIGFSSFGVLLYYAVANAAALSQDHPHRRYPRALQVAGLVGCSLLVVTLQWQSVLSGVGLVVMGVCYRAVWIARRGRSGGQG